MIHPMLALPAALIQPAADALSSIGTATMEANGTIVLRLRAERGGTIGEGVLRYPPSDPHYQTVRNHLPGLRPGATLPVPPFP